MKNRIFGISIIFVLCQVFFAAAAAFAQEEKTAAQPVSFVAERLKEERAKKDENKKNFVWRVYSGRPLPEYERLTYSIKWKFVAVGDATLEIRGFDDIDGRQAYHFYSYAKSKQFFDEFYKVRDINEAWLDKESAASLKFSSFIRQGGWSKTEDLYFDQAEHTFVLNDSGKMMKGHIPDYVQDVMTALYYVRTMDLKVGDQCVLDAHSGDLSWPMGVKVLKKEKIKTQAGEFNCIAVEPFIRQGAGLFQAQGKMTVWLTDDDRRIPVYLKSKVFIGSVNAELIKIETPKPDEFITPEER